MELPVLASEFKEPILEALEAGADGPRVLTGVERLHPVRRVLLALSKRRLEHYFFPQKFERTKESPRTIKCRLLSSRSSFPK